SSYWQKGDELKINIEPNINIEFELEKNINSNKELKNFFSEFISSRFAEFLCDELKINKPLNQLSKKDKQNIIDTFNNYKVTPLETEGYTKAEVTIGGVDTKELNQKT